MTGVRCSTDHTAASPAHLLPHSRSHTSPVPSPLVQASYSGDSSKMDLAFPVRRHNQVAPVAARSNSSLLAQYSAPAAAHPGVLHAAPAPLASLARHLSSSTHPPAPRLPPD